MTVPKSMGWLWDIDGSNWRPGTIEKSVTKIMKYFATQKRLLLMKSKTSEKLPTLKLVRKNGEYEIVLNPLSILDTDDATPIVFKLNKSDYAKKVSRARENLREKGFNFNCKCGKDLENCECINPDEKEKIQIELDTTELTFQEVFKPTNDDEIDLTFSPAILSDKKPSKIERVTYASTQYDKNDVKSSLKSIETTESQLKVETNSKKLKHGRIPLEKGSKDDKKM